MSLSHSEKQVKMKSLVGYCGLILAFVLSCTEQAGVRVKTTISFIYFTQEQCLILTLNCFCGIDRNKGQSFLLKVYCMFL